MGIQNVVFDMGNVLVTDDMELYMAPYLPQAEDRQMMQKELFDGPEWKGWDAGNCTEEEVVLGACTRLPQRLHTAARQLTAQWHMQPVAVPGMESLIKQLKAAGLGVYLLSNTATSYYAYRHLLPGIQLFDGEFISADVHLLKPNKEIYLAFLDKYHLQAQACFFVDDKEENVRGAKQAGMGGHVFTGDVEALAQALQQAGVML